MVTCPSSRRSHAAPRKVMYTKAYSDIGMTQTMGALKRYRQITSRETLNINPAIMSFDTKHMALRILSNTLIIASFLV
jgi:hypothetical protein